jgi:E3 ubiquitin-protein ligase UBR7
MADVFEDESEQTVSIKEFLDGVEDLELEADLVLGGDDGKECTYSKGYMKRQAIFSCLTCTPDANSGVCTACCLSCHDGHEIVELWTKRNFRCDCGNSKFGEFFCKLFAGKEVENTDNSYNHNFKGEYCTCDRLYPDPNMEDQVEMIQCCICEDWFHEEHIGVESPDEVPRDEEGEPLYEDFICQLCSEKCSFLTLYPKTIWATKEVDASEISDENTRLNQCVQGAGPSTTTCVIGSDLITAPPPVPEKNKPMFLAKNWREKICTCETCAEFCRKKGIGFLLDKEDSIAEYEKVGKKKRVEKLQVQEGIEQSFINKLGHVEKMEFLSGVADMKNEIHSFLETFDASKPITAEDVHQVFENLAKKRRRMD